MRECVCDVTGRIRRPFLLPGIVIVGANIPVYVKLQKYEAPTAHVKGSGGLGQISLSTFAAPSPARFSRFVTRATIYSLPLKLS